VVRVTETHLLGVFPQCARAEGSVGSNNHRDVIAHFNLSVTQLFALIKIPVAVQCFGTIAVRLVRESGGENGLRSA
jgi:hypothetical protein